MGDRVRLVAVPPQELREPGELARGLLGHLARGQTGAQPVRLGESLAEQIQLVGDQQIVEGQTRRPRLTVLVKLVWMTMRCRSDTISSGGFCSDSRYWRSCR